MDEPEVEFGVLLHHLVLLLIEVCEN